MSKVLSKMWLKDAEDNYIAPGTTTTMVYSEDGERLDDTLSDMVKAGPEYVESFLPEGYEKIDYVTCDNYTDTADSWSIFTGYTIQDFKDLKVSFDVKFRLNQHRDYMCLGFASAYKSEDHEMFRVISNTYSSGLIIGMGQSPNNGHFYNTGCIKYKDINEVRMRYTKDKFNYDIYVNGEQWYKDYTVYNGTPDPDAKIYLLYAGPYQNNPASIDHYGLTLYDKDMNMIRNYIPCIRISDGEVGFFESVLGDFKTNEGHGKFKCCCHYTARR